MEFPSSGGVAERRGGTAIGCQKKTPSSKKQIIINFLIFTSTTTSTQKIVFLLKLPIATKTQHPEPKTQHPMTTPTTTHIGRKISRIRELRGMKQEALATALGVSQQTVSNLENSEELDDKRLKEVAEALGVSKEAIENFSEEAVFSYFNSFNDNQGQIYTGHNCTFNPLDKVVELYERLVQAEKDKVEFLERLLNK